MSYFHTIEFSDPRFERDGLRQITVKSKALSGRGDISVYVPDEVNKDTPIAILLHGVYGSHWAWSMKAGAHKTAHRLIENKEISPMIIAMPSDGLWGDGSGYMKHIDQDFETWIVKEVPIAVEELLETEGNTRPMFIGGLSMGGFGAMRLGAKYGHLFSAIYGLSSVTSLRDLIEFVEDDWSRMSFDWEDSALRKIIPNYRDQLPPLRFDCGTEDDLLEANRSLHKKLTELEIEHGYEEFSGGHEWIYWETHLENTLRFFSQNLS